MIATVDCAAGDATLDAHPESVKQAALADRIVLTKTDLADSSALAERLRRLNPAAPQFTARHGAVDPSLLFNASVYEPRLYESHAHSGDVTTFCLRRSAPLHAVTLSLFLQVLAEHCGAKLLRLKGLVDVVESPGRPALIHGVQHVFHPPAWLDAWPDDDRTTRIVVIAQGLDAGWLQDLIEVLDDEVNMFDLIIRSDRVVTPARRRACDVAIRARRSPPSPRRHASRSAGGSAHRRTGKIVMPGGIDPHVHCKWYSPQPDGRCVYTDGPRGREPRGALRRHDDADRLRALDARQDDPAGDRATATRTGPASATATTASTSW